MHKANAWLPCFHALFFLAVPLCLTCDCNFACLCACICWCKLTGLPRFSITFSLPPVAGRTGRLAVYGWISTSNARDNRCCWCKPCLPIEDAHGFSFREAVVLREDQWIFTHQSSCSVCLQGLTCFRLAQAHNAS